MFDKILVGYRDDEHGADALALASDLARLTGADLLLASVVPAVWVETLAESRGAAVVHGGARDRAAAALREAAAALAGAPGLQRVERRLEASSSPAYGLYSLAETEGADLIVLGSSHRGAVGRTALGTVADRLLHGAPCAVAVAPRGFAEHEPRGLDVVGVAFDGSAEARLALRCAHALAASAGAALRVLTVLVPLPSAIERWVPLHGTEGREFVERGAALERQEQMAANSVSEAVGQLDARVEIETSMLRAKDVAQALLDATQGQVDLMMLGSRGYGPLRRTLLGSVSVALVRAAPMPLLVLPRGVEPS